MCWPSVFFPPQRLSLAVQDSIAQANEAANEAVSGIRVVRSFNTEKHEARRYDDRLMDTHTLKTRRDTVRAIYLLARRVRSLYIIYEIVTHYYKTPHWTFFLCVFVADRFVHADLHVVLRQAVHPERTDDHWQPGFLHPLPVRPWRQHQGIT